MAYDFCDVTPTVWALEAMLVAIPFVRAGVAVDNLAARGGVEMAILLAWEAIWAWLRWYAVKALSPRPIARPAIRIARDARVKAGCEDVSGSKAGVGKAANAGEA